MKETNLPLVRASGIVDASIEKVFIWFIFKVFDILTNRKKDFDNMYNSTKEIEVIVQKKFEVKNEVIHLLTVQLYNGIFPVGKRDFVFVFKKVEFSDGSIKLGAISIEHPKCPPTNNATRG